jgi:hypothetical protein
MLNERFRSLTGMSWEETANLSNQLYFEADQLDERAFLLLESDSVGPAIWAEFASVKRAAKSKRADARREWLRATQILNLIDPRAGKPLGQKIH